MFIGAGDGGADGGALALRVAAASSTTVVTSMPGDASGAVVIPLAAPVLPQESPRPEYPILVDGSFNDASWDPALRAQLVMAEFGASGWEKKDQITVLAPDISKEALAAEIDELMYKASALRSIRLPEIVAQANDLTQYWEDLMNIGPSHPATQQLVAIAMDVGHMAAMFFKNHFKRARPVQVYPTIMPAIMTPPHPSYPNGHALQSHLLSLCLMSATSPQLHNKPENSPYRHALITLADRVAENREIAGLHFPSDARASRILVPQIWYFLKNGEIFQSVVAAAAKEWPAVRSVAHTLRPPPPRTAYTEPT